MDSSVSSVAAAKRAAARNRMVRKTGKFLFSILRLVFLISVGYIVLYPLLYMIVSSVTPREEILTSARTWIPEVLTLKNYEFVIGVMDYWRSLWSTFSNEIIAAMLEVCSCAVVAYGFARFKFKLKGPLMAILYLTILIPMTMLIIPMSVNFANLDFLGILGLFNRLTGIDLRPNLIGSPLAFYLPAITASGLQSGILILIYIQFFKEMPVEFEEAAQVDGAGPLRTFLKIIIPSAGVVIITVVIFSLIWHWNDYQMALMFMGENYPLSVKLSTLAADITARNIWSNTGVFVLAGCVLFVVPLLIVYMVLQRWFIESVDRVGITG